MHRSIKMVYADGRFLQEVLSGAGEPDTARIALEQGNAETVLKQLNPPAHRRLRDVQDSRRPAKAPMLCRNQRIATISEIKR